MTITLFLGLPTDILVDEILLRLSVTSLIALKRVNKYFHTLISSQKFIQLHSRHQLNINRFLLLESKEYNRDEPLYCLELDSPTTRVMKLPGKSFYRSSQFVGSCHGLFCFVLDRRGYRPNYAAERLVFANPCTGNQKLSSFLKLDIHRPTSNGGLDYPTTFGFGYDSINDDYKVVGYNRQYVGRGDDGVDKYIVQVVVYSMRTDTWRHIDNVGTCPEDYVFDDNVVVVNNHLLHWYFLSHSVSRDKRRQRGDRVRCFDLETEKWMAEDVPLPQCYFHHWNVINGNLCLTFTDYKTRQFTIWIMKDYGVKESWVKFIINFPEGITLYTNHLSFAYSRTETGEVKILFKANSDVYTCGLYMDYWHFYDMNRQTYDKLEGIPPDLKVIATSTLSFISRLSPQVTI